MPPITRSASKTYNKPETAYKESLNRKNKKPSVNIHSDLGTIHFVGGDLPNENENENENLSSKFPHLPHRLYQLQKQKRNSKMYLWFQTESPDGINHYPILIAVICKCVPTTLVAKTSVQNGTEEITPMEKEDLRWKGLPSYPSIFALRGGHKTSEYMSMFIPKPSEVDDEGPVPVGHITVSTTNSDGEKEDILWDPLNDDVDKVTEGNDKLKRELLLEKKAKEIEEERLLSVKKQQYNTMLSTIAAGDTSSVSDVKNKLEAMRVYKIFPDGVPQQISTPFGFTGGFLKNTVVNRYAKAIQWFDK